MICYRDQTFCENAVGGFLKPKCGNTECSRNMSLGELLAAERERIPIAWGALKGTASCIGFIPREPRTQKA